MNRESWNHDQLGTRRRLSPRPQLFNVRRKIEKLSISQNLLDRCPLNNAQLANRVVQRRDIVKDEEYCRTVFAQQGQQQNSWIQFQNFLIGLDKHVTQFQCTLRFKWQKLHDVWKLPEEECLEIWTRIPPRQRPKDWDKMIEDLVVPLQRYLNGHAWARLLWERKIEEVRLEIALEEVPTLECLYVHKKLVLFLSIYKDDFKNDPRKTE